MRTALFLCIAATMTGSGCFLVPGTPEAAFHDFQTNDHKESYLVLPLCIAGDKVVPLVVEKVRDKDLRRRRYAIGFLGTAGDDTPIPVLENIVNDDSELEYFRGDALEALFVLNEKKGLAAASTYQERNDLLGTVSRQLLAVSDHHQFELDYRKSTCQPDD